MKTMLSKNMEKCQLCIFSFLSLKLQYILSKHIMKITFLLVCELMIPCV